MKKLSLSLIAAAVLSLGGCANSQKINHTPTNLKDKFKNDFLIGAAISAAQVDGKDAVATRLVPTQLNTITPENVMKSAEIHPTWNDYNFKPADDFVKYGQKHHMFIVGHTLIWHSQLSPFAQRIHSADSLKQFMQEHIRTVAGRYAGKVNSWDVVNEALNEDGSLRKSVFLERLGPGYLAEAFKLAAKAAPNTLLYYNDYNIEQPAKRKGAIELIKNIQAAGAKIDGVGIQGHWHLGQVPFKDIEQSILDYAALGIKVAITELDINVLPRPERLSGAEVSQHFASDPKLNPYPNGLPQAVQEQLKNDYETLFRIFLKHKDKISRVTFWGVYDGQSWLNNWPVRGRTNYPLLFDRKGDPKPAYQGVINLSN
jgi:endo-1,4-beta-xylanase